MIRYLEDNEKRLSEPLYREAFPQDKDVFVEYYYSYGIKNNRILVLERENVICSMMHLNPYRLSVNGTAVDAYYYVAVATKEKCRHQGMMRSLLHKSLNDINEKMHPFAYLMPESRTIYEPFDFRIVYKQEKVELPSEPAAANTKMAEMFDVFTLRDEWYMEQQTEEARICAGEPPFEIVPYIMARITHVEKMLSLLRSKQPVKVLLNVQDEIIEDNKGLFLWEISETESKCCKLSDDAAVGENISKNSLTIAELTEFVFGKRKIQGLEDIKVLSRICINEAV